ncbi:MAG: Rieske 2Fe-2S domain-containing protein [Gemmatimonadales bacterium]|nr:Rieske 2Fe-2S domain-containing protein [Gemmatimonadales bacterium]
MADETHGAVTTRRRFVNWLLGTSLGGLLLTLLYPVGRYLIPPAAAEAAANSVTLDLSPEELAPNSGRIFKFGNRPAILINTSSGELRAFSAVCTHLACTVQYRPDLGHIWCACHNGHFDLNGTNIAGPPPRPLQPYVVNVRGERVVVSKSA